MGTFHHDRSPLHGITVVVETSGCELYVGRCDDEDDERVVLLDADVHRDEDAAARTEFLRRAAQVGVWGRERRVVIPRPRVRSLRRLSELEA